MNDNPMYKFVFTLLAMALLGCSKAEFNPKWLTEQAPETFSARFETTKGDFDILVKRRLSPKAADRFYQLIKYRYYDNAAFYRVVPGFVAQFGNSDAAVMRQWQSVKVPDEKVIYGNKKGSISFARFEKDSRDVEVFINLDNNSQLDTVQFGGVRGFPAFGDVTKGMDVVESLYGGYGEKTMDNMDNFYINRPLFFSKFPKIDIIHKAYLLD